MKIKYLLIGFLILNLVPLSNPIQILNFNLQISDSSLGFTKNEVKTYKIISFDENLAEEYLGVSYITIFLGKRAYVGAYRFIRINNIKYVNNLTSLSDNQLCSGWIVNLSSWEWVTHEDWELRQGEPDAIYEDLKIYENPKDLGEEFYDIENMADEEKYVFDYLNFPYAVPIPVDEYLNQIDWAPNWTIEATKISIKYKESQGKFVEKVHTFNNNGFLERSILLTDDGRIIFEYSLEPEYVSIFVFILIMGLSIVFLIGIIYVFIKKVRL